MDKPADSLAHQHDPAFKRLGLAAASFQDHTQWHCSYCNSLSIAAVCKAIEDGCELQWHSDRPWLITLTKIPNVFAYNDATRFLAGALHALHFFDATPEQRWLIQDKVRVMFDVPGDGSIGYTEYHEAPIKQIQEAPRSGRIFQWPPK